MLVGLPWNLSARPLDAGRSTKKTAPKRETEQAELSPVDHAVRHPRAVVSRLDREQRRDLLTQLSQAAPNLSQNPEQLCAPLEQLERTLQFTGKSQNGYAMGFGFSAGRTYEASPPRKRATMAEAVADYGKYLDKIVHAEGRESAQPSEADQQSALTCVDLQYNYLHRDSQRTQLFERLVQFLQYPMNALGVLQDLETVPADRRQAVLDELETRVRALRARGSAPQNHNEAMAEGANLNTLSRRLSMAGRLQRSGESLGEILDQMTAARKPLPAELRGQAMEAIEVAAHYRRAGETLEAGMTRFAPAYLGMKALTGVDSSTALVLMSELPASNPQQVEDLTECGEYLRSLPTLPPEVAGPALQAAFAGYRKPIESLKRVLRSFELTGDLQGLDKARTMIDFKLDAGQLIGTRDEWMQRLEHRLEELTLFERDPKKAFVRAQKELFDSTGGRLGEQNGYLVIGTSRLPVKLK